MRDLEWFIDEGPELARLGHYVWTDHARGLNHLGNGHPPLQMERLDGLVFPGVPYPGTRDPSVILICPSHIPGVTSNNNDDRRDRDWWFTLRRLFSPYYQRALIAQREGRLTVRPEWTMTVLRRHLFMVAGPDGQPGEVRDGVAVG